MQDARRREVVALFEAHGAIAEPGLVEALSLAPDGPVRLQAVLGKLAEIPFHFDPVLWERLEAQMVEASLPPPPPPTLGDDAERARKEAMRRNAARVYDSPAEAPAPEGEGDESEPEDGADGAIEIEAVPTTAAEEARGFRVEPRSDWSPLAAQHPDQVEVVADMTGNSTCEGTTGDFATYFQARYTQIAKMLRGRRELRNAMPVERVKPGMQEVQLIVMVDEVVTTKNGHKRLAVQDGTGAITALVRADEQALMAMANSIVADEVIGLVGQASSKGDLLFLSAIVRPDIPMPDPTVPRGAAVPLMAAFLSDIHVGSKTFLDPNWKRMLRWLNGHGATKRERDAAGRVKYLVIPGDLVDGVGIYPGQQDELSIKDIYDQYGAFGDWIRNVPSHVQVIIQPGNHDASRPAEPQPAFSTEVRARFDHHATKFLANPATFKMHGVTTLGYHGNSLIDYAASVSGFEFSAPLPIMKQMLQSRHVAPLYGERTPVAPEHHDYLVISTVPDLFVTGHVHVPGIEAYRGVQMVNSGTWQSQTSYQKMLNFTPDPAKMPLMDLQSLRGTLVDFQTPENAGQIAPV
ncbi:MAG: DNA-directed DNA polymerase II small subunit [Candidatus Thermoplasmatota archaeon]